MPAFHKRPFFAAQAERGECLKPSRQLDDLVREVSEGFPQPLLDSEAVDLVPGVMNPRAASIDTESALVSLF